MKRFTLVACAVLVVFFALNLFAQEKRGSTYYGVWYFKIPPGKTGEFLDLVKQWKPVEEELLKQGKTTVWALYRVEYPAGLAREYDYVAITGYPDFGKAKGGYPTKLRKVSHPNWGKEEWDKYWVRAKKARDYVKKELWVLRDQIETGTTKYLQVNYMKVPPGGGAKYMELESERAKPFQKFKQDNGYLASWLVMQLLFPSGTDSPYNYGTIDFYQKFEDIAKPVPSDLWESAKKDYRDETKEWSGSAVEIRSLVSRQLWVVVDYLGPENN